MIEPHVVVVPAGDALLGDPPRTEHVNIFAIARRPVSVGEYAMFVDATQHHPPTEWKQKRRTSGAALEGVSWADAVAYCRWLTVGTGRIYRLPDEREWEKPHGYKARSRISAYDVSGPTAGRTAAGYSGQAPIRRRACSRTTTSRPSAFASCVG